MVADGHPQTVVGIYLGVTEDDSMSLGIRSMPIQVQFRIAPSFPEAKSIWSAQPFTE